MTQYLNFLLLGLGSGAVFAAIAIALVVTFRSSGVVNFATGAMALYVAYTYAFLRQGKLLDPIPGLPSTVDLGSPLSLVPALVISLAIAALLGLLQYGLIYRPLRRSSPVAKAVASIGVMLMIQALLGARIGTSPVSVKPLLATRTVTVGDVRIGEDRLLIAAIVVVIGLLLGALVKFTRFGLATRAVAETERGAVVSGLRPDSIASINWALSSVVAGLVGILIAPILPLTPGSYTLFIIPALAAALVGRFTGLGPAVAAGLAIGALQSETVYLQSVWTWLPSSGLDKAVPLVLMLVVLLVRGRHGIPQRAEVAQKSLGRAPLPRNLPLATAIGVVVGVSALLLTHGNWRIAVITSMTSAILALSYVVVTGYAGQISLAQLVLAGGSAFLLSRLTTHWGVPFPLAPLLSAAGVTVLGVILGLPALRLRGLPVAVVTLALAATVESIWFLNPKLNGGSSGAPIKSPTLFGINLGIGSGLQYPRISFGLTVLAVLLLTALGVAFLRRSRLGAQMLAVRANERSAAASGIDVARVKVTAFAIGAFIAGLGGAFTAYQQQTASATSFSTLAGIGLFASVYLMGVSSILGGLAAGVGGAGGVIYLALNKSLDLSSYYAVLTGALLVLTVVTYPEGVMGPVHEAIRRSRDRRATPVSDADEVTVLDEIRPSPEAGEELLTVSSIGVRYGGAVALDDVSFAVRQGEILGLIGPNGAGKTTLLDALSGFAPRASGSVTLAGVRIEGHAPFRRVRAGLGRTFQAIELYEDLSVEENISVGATGARGRTPVQGEELSRLLQALGLGQLLTRPVSELSQGQRQMVSIARALAGRPAVVLLDEPAAGLDSNESLWLGERLQALRGTGSTIVMIDHDMGLVLKTCDRIVVLDLGRKIAEGTPSEIRGNAAVVRAYLGGGHADLPGSPHAPDPIDDIKVTV